jgi:uncharacterized protein
MAKIVVVSDNHGLTAELNEILTIHQDSDLFIHCGDSEFKINHPLFDSYQAVKGNCDFREFKEVDHAIIEGKKVLWTHGHHHGVKGSLNTLYALSLEEGADLVCFGHTHRPMVSLIGNVTFFNPGSIEGNRPIQTKTYGVIHIEDGKIRVNHYDAHTHELIRLK